MSNIWTCKSRVVRKRPGECVLSLIHISEPTRLLSISYAVFCLQFILLLFCAHCLYARALPFIHTLTRSLSDDLRFARPDIGRFVSIVQVFDETVCLARNWTLSFDSGILFFLYSCYYFDSCISHLAAFLFLISFEIMCSLYMYYCSDR